MTRIIVILLSLLSLSLALKEVPLVNVNLAGGPENRMITLGSNFEITCNYTIATTPSGESWRPQMTFYKDGAQLGRFESELILFWCFQIKRYTFNNANKNVQRKV